MVAFEFASKLNCIRKSFELSGIYMLAHFKWNQTRTFKVLKAYNHWKTAEIPSKSSNPDDLISSNQFQSNILQFSMLWHCAIFPVAFELMNILCVCMSRTRNLARNIEQLLLCVCVCVWRKWHFQQITFLIAFTCTFSMASNLCANVPDH